MADEEERRTFFVTVPEGHDLPPEWGVPEWMVRRGPRPAP